MLRRIQRMPLADIYTVFVRIEARASIKKWLCQLPTSIRAQPLFEPGFYTNKYSSPPTSTYVQYLSPALRALRCSTHTTLSHQKACILNVELSELAMLNQCLGVRDGADSRGNSRVVDCTNDRKRSHNTFLYPFFCQTME